MVLSVTMHWTDFEFNAATARVMEICCLIRDTLVHPIRFYAWLRIDKLNPALLETIYMAGGRQIFIGLEAVDDGILQLMNKGYTAATALEKLRLLADFQDRHLDFHYEFNLITNYPGETLTSVKNTLATVLENPRLFYRRVSAVVVFMLHEGTPAYQHLGAAAKGCMAPVFPPETTLRSYRYLMHLAPDPTLADRREIWSAVAAVVHRKA